MSIEGGNHYDRFQEKQEDKVVERLIKVGHKLNESDQDKSEELEAIKDELKSRGIEYDFEESSELE